MNNSNLKSHIVKSRNLDLQNARTVTGNLFVLMPDIEQAAGQKKN